MPNGNPNFATEELPALEAFFNPLAPVLERFADEHNLVVDRYYHDAPSWDFRFRHPSGGEAYVEVRRAGEDVINIVTAWWQDDFAAGARSVKTKLSEPLRLESLDLYSALVSALREILGWRADSWDQVYGGYKSIWHRTWDEPQFRALIDRLPTPKLSNET